MRWALGLSESEQWRRARLWLLALPSTVLALAAWRFFRQRRMKVGAPADLTAFEAALASTPPPVLGRRATEVVGRQWYREAVVSDCSAAYGLDGVRDAVRGLHLGAATNPPESLVRLRRPTPQAAWAPVGGCLLKRSLRFTLLAFCWLEDGAGNAGFAPRSAALLLGLGGGALLHFWRTLRNGATMRCDACELDGAVVALAREFLCLGACEAFGGGANIATADGADVLASADDDAYALLVCDLDMGTLLSDATAARHMRRVLRPDGVLVVNDYSEEAPSDRLLATVRAARLLRAEGFEEVHVIRTTAVNSMLLAPATARGWGRAELAAAAERLDLGVGVAALLREVPERRHSVF